MRQEAQQQQQDLAVIFSRRPEDEDFSMHPPGCRHQASCTRISECADTWSTRLVGGVKEIEDRIVAIEESVDRLPLHLKIDMPGMHLGQHSLVLPCEICKKHSVVSWE